MNESDLYQSIKRFLEEKYSCFYSCIEAGKQGFGSIDVFGVRYANIEKTKIETIGVEAKVNKTNVCANFGQAKGYSLFCHKVYFASFQDGSEKHSFSDDDIKAAKHLGIGIIRIYGVNPPNFICEKVLEAKNGNPMHSLLADVLKNNRVFQCATCKNIQHYEKEDFETVRYSKHSVNDRTKQQIKNGKSLLFQRIGYGDNDKEEFYCNPCARIKLKV